MMQRVTKPNTVIVKRRDEFGTGQGHVVGVVPVDIRTVPLY
jgi:hypothetical protein